MIDDKVEVTALGDTVREFEQAYVTVGGHKVIMGGGRNIGKTMSGRIALEQGVFPARITGADAGSDDVVIQYTIDESDNLLEAMALGIESYGITVDGKSWGVDGLTNNVAGDRAVIGYKTIEERMLDYYSPIPLSPEDLLDIYKVHPGNGKGGRGPKGGGAQRLAKRRAKNKAARKARRHG